MPIECTSQRIFIRVPGHPGVSAPHAHHPTASPKTHACMRRQRERDKRRRDRRLQHGDCLCPPCLTATLRRGNEEGTLSVLVKCLLLALAVSVCVYVCACMRLSVIRHLNLHAYCLFVLVCLFVCLSICLLVCGLLLHLLLLLLLLHLLLQLLLLLLLHVACLCLSWYISGSSNSSSTFPSLEGLQFVRRAPSVSKARPSTLSRASINASLGVADPSVCISIVTISPRDS